MIVRQIFVGVLAWLMLIASSGATVHQMVCLHSGNAEYSFKDINCCTGDTEGDSIKRSCCEYFAITFQTDDLVNVNQELDPDYSTLGNISNQFGKQKYCVKKDLNLIRYNLPPPNKLPKYKELQSFLC